MFDPIGDTNAIHSENKVPRSPIEPIRMARIHRVIRTILSGPDYVIARRNKEDYDKLGGFDLILRIIRSRPALVRESWAFYRPSGEVPGAILRYARIESKSVEKARVNDSLPQITQITRYVSAGNVQSLMLECETLDSILLSGNLFQPSASDNDPWYTHTLYRAMEVATVELSWNALSQAPALEAQMQLLADMILVALRKDEEECPEKIERLEFIYTRPEPDAIYPLTQANPQSEIPNPK